MILQFFGMPSLFRIRMAAGPYPHPCKFHNRGVTPDFLERSRHFNPIPRKEERKKINMNFEYTDENKHLLQ